MIRDNIFVTQPSLPPIEEFKILIDKIWDKKWISNNGMFHEEFEHRLKEYLKVRYITVVSNGTLALLITLKALKLKGEIITTPFTFVATTNAIEWMGCKPIFCDINSHDYNIDVDKIETLITKKTVAIMPVHVFGTPCNNDKLAKIAKKHNVKLIYDAAHAFNVTDNNEQILNWGDFSILSFHATKAFNTIEGGAIISNTEEAKEKVDSLRNFGYNTKDVIVRSGINAKMNELQAAYGLLQLKESTNQICKRKKVFINYLEGLSNVEGIILPTNQPTINSNYSYFPIRITKKCKVSRENFISKMHQENIYPRKYFYPLVSNMVPYQNNKSGDPHILPVANMVSNEILCLPIYENLIFDDQRRIIKIIKELT